MAPTSYYIYVLKGSIEVAEQNKGQGAQDINELIKVRRNKLSDLQANGKDPFKITKYDVTAHSEDIKAIMMNMTAKKYVLPEELCQSVLWVKLHFAIYQIRQGLFRVMYSVTCLVRTLIRILRNMTLVIS